MRKLAILGGIVVAGVFAAANTGGALDGYVQALNNAKSVKADYTVQVIGGMSKTYSVQLSKPNMVRIDGPNELIVADGQNVTTYDKKNKTYFKKAQDNNEVMGMFNEDDLSIFAPFFNSKSFNDLKTTDGGVKNRKGLSLHLVNGTAPNGKRQANFYLDDTQVARQLEFVYPDNNIRVLVDTKNVTVSGDVMGGDAFAFKAPEGARELSAEEMNAGKWFHNLDEAKKIALATNKIIMIDFMTTWCGPCKMMAAEAFTSEPFLQRTKKLVLCKLDAEVETGLAAQYEVNAYPTVVFIKPDGTMVHKFVGYGGIDQVVGEVDKALAAAQ